MTSAPAATVRPASVASLPGAVLLPIAAVAAAALAALWAWGASPAGRYLEHRVDSPIVLEPGTAIALFAMAWILMTAATMLPTALPMIVAFRSVVARREDATALVWWLAAGFGASWAVAGVAAAVGDLAAHELLSQSGLDRHPQIVSGAGLGLAAAYQLSRLAQSCLRACRSPFGFLARHWTGRSDVTRQAFAVGGAYAWSCLGCCAALMLVMLGIGMGNVGWMLALGAIAAAQKIAPFGDRLRVLVGILLALGAVAVSVS